ncbi:unnamed protein product [Amoebophrya sp. A120]|nr:unnamed protein product [Amoebophrya sp. A120]|eukprot:GSA120T00018742001.1
MDPQIADLQGEWQHSMGGVVHVKFTKVFYDKHTFDIEKLPSDQWGLKVGTYYLSCIQSSAEGVTLSFVPERDRFSHLFGASSTASPSTMCSWFRPHSWARGKREAALQAEATAERRILEEAKEENDDEKMLKTTNGEQDFLLMNGSSSTTSPSVKATYSAGASASSTLPVVGKIIKKSRKNSSKQSNNSPGNKKLHKKPKKPTKKDTGSGPTTPKNIKRKDSGNSSATSEKKGHQTEKKKKSTGKNNSATSTSTSNVASSTGTTSLMCVEGQGEHEQQQPSTFSSPVLGALPSTTSLASTLCPTLSAGAQILETYYKQEDQDQIQTGRAVLCSTAVLVQRPRRPNAGQHDLHQAIKNENSNTASIDGEAMDQEKKTEVNHALVKNEKSDQERPSGTISAVVVPVDNWEEHMKQHGLDPIADDYMAPLPFRATLAAGGS